MDEVLLARLKDISLSLFRKDFFGIYHGSISAKAASGSFLINKRDTIFDEFSRDSMIKVYSYSKDYRWNEASIDAGIHEEIYKNILSAKFICYTMPQYTTSYSLYNDVIEPKDYFGQTVLGRVRVYDPMQFLNWYERAPAEISQYFTTKDTNLMVIRGYGIYAYDRDLFELVKKIGVLEKSCRLLSLADD
ncbi:MAG: class II aldolase and adducin N-terminal domain-containing protein [Campylobacterota bacterium]